MELLTVADIAHLLKKSKKTIQNRLSAGTLDIPYVRLKGKGNIFFRKEVVEKYLDKRTIHQK